MSPDDGTAPARGGGTAVRAREAAVLDGLRTLAAALDDEPDPAFRAATRDRLVAMAAVRTPDPAPRPRRWWPAAHRDGAPPPAWRTRLAGGMAAAALTVTALGSLTALATDARPGDVLYGVKRGTEQTELALAGDDRGATLLEFAGTRLDELAALRGTGSPAAVADLLGTMDAQTTEGAVLLATRAVDGADAAPAEQLAAWAGRQRAGLVALQPEVSGAAAGSLDLLAAVGRRAAALRTALACPGGPVTAGTDELGPVPAACPAEQPPPVVAGPAEPGSAAPSPQQPVTGVPPAPALPTAATGATGATGATPGPGTPKAAGLPSPGVLPAPTMPTAPQGPPAGRSPDPAPLPVPPGGGEPGDPVRPEPAAPPLVDTSLPVCIPLLLC